MRIHKLTLSFLVVTLILTALHIWKLVAYQTFSRKIYSFSASVAEHHPIMGKFELITENKNESIIVTEDYEKSFANYGGIYEYEFENFPPPYTLDCHWVSVRERKIYKGTFELPHKKIDSFFGLKSTKMNEFSKPNGTVDGYQFGVGIAPGGMVTLWVSGKHFFQKEIAIFYAKEYDSYNWNVDGQELLKTLPKGFKSTNRKTDSIIKNNFPPEMDKWKTYSKKYLYYTQIIGYSDDVTSIDVSCFNEESDRFKTNNSAKQLIYTGVPNHIDINKTELKDRKSYSLSEDYITNFKTEKTNLTAGDTLVFIIEKGIDNRLKTLLTTVNQLNSKKE